MTALQDHLIAAAPAVKADALALAGIVTALCATVLAASLLVPAGRERTAMRLFALTFALGAAVSAVGIWRLGIPVEAFSDAAVASTGMSQAALDRAFSAFLSTTPAGVASGPFSFRWLDAVLGVSILAMASFALAMLSSLTLPLFRGRAADGVRVAVASAACLGIAWVGGAGVTVSAHRMSPELSVVKRFERAAVYAGPLMARLGGREVAALAARR